MIKNSMVWLLGLMMALAAGLAFANATAFNITGTVTVQTGAGVPRPVRQGDTLRTGDTVVTGASSTAVLQFPDGQIAALGAISRMTITAYEFNEQAKTGNILLSLISGGMRAVTGLIGSRTPDKVSYRAGTATIGIRGTDILIAVTAGGGTMSVIVKDGLISFTYGGRTVSIPTNQGVLTNRDGTMQVLPAAQILQAIRAVTGPGAADAVVIADALASVSSSTIENAVRDAITTRNRRGVAVGAGVTAAVVATTNDASASGG